jgi:hypothetical protein
MNPLWIIDFSSNEAFKKQIKSLKSAVIAPNREWLKYSFFSNEKLEDTINVNNCFKTGADLFKPEGDMQPYFDYQKFNAHIVQTSSGTQPTFVFDVHFVCDIRKPDACEALFEIVDKLKKSKFVDTPNKYFYLHLWMPEGLNLTDRVKDFDSVFFNLLHNFQKEKIFDYVLIYTST